MMNLITLNGSGKKSMKMKSFWMKGLVSLLLLQVSFVQSAVLKKISFSALPDHAIQVNLTADQAFTTEKHFSTDHPARIIIDFIGVSSGLKKKKEEVGIGVLMSVTAVDVSGTTRLVLNLSKKAPYNIVLNGTSAVITVNASQLSQNTPQALPSNAIQVRVPVASNPVRGASNALPSKNKGALVSRKVTASPVSVPSKVSAPVRAPIVVNNAPLVSGKDNVLPSKNQGALVSHHAEKTTIPVVVPSVVKPVVAMPKTVSVPVAVQPAAKITPNAVVAKSYMPSMSSDEPINLNPAPKAIKIIASTSQQMKAVDFKRGKDGAGQIIFVLSDSSSTVDLSQEGGNVILNFKDMTIPEHLVRKFDVSDFATPVKQFEALPSAKDVRVEIQSDGDYEHLAYQTGNTYTIEFRPLSKRELDVIEAKKGFDGERLSLNFQDIKVRSVLQLLGDFTELNMVVSDTVDGSITLRLQNVPWDQALDIILRTKGLAKRETGNVILIAPAEEIADQEKSELESQLQIEELAGLHSEYIDIKYAKASDIAALLKSEDNQLLTPERGNVAVDERTNTLLVRDTLAQIEDIHRLVNRLDVPVRQVLIDSRIVIASETFARDIGVKFGYSTSGGKAGSHEWILGGAQSGGLSGTANVARGIALGVSPVITAGDATADALLVNLPSVLAATRGGGFNFLLGKVGSYLLQLELTAMQSEGRGEIVSSPRVITSNRSRATIKESVEIPYQSAVTNADGTTSTTTTFQEVQLSLDVIPQITPDDRVIMDLVIKKESANFANVVAGQPSIDKREVKTSVLVDNGETVVLGGVFERSKSISEEKIPLLGDLPYVGLLFKNKVELDNSRELLVFVTPKVLKDTVGLR